MNLWAPLCHTANLVSPISSPTPPTTPGLPEANSRHHIISSVNISVCSSKRKEILKILHYHTKNE